MEEKKLKELLKEIVDQNFSEELMEKLKEAKMMLISARS